MCVLVTQDSLTFPPKLNIGELLGRIYTNAANSDVVADYEHQLSDLLVEKTLPISGSDAQVQGLFSKPCRFK